MKVKNLMIGDIAKIKYERISMEEYYPSIFDDGGNFPNLEGESLFYKIGNYAFDLIHFKGYKLVPYQEKYSDTLRNKKVVMLALPFSDICSSEKISRKNAVLTYRNTSNGNK